MKTLRIGKTSLESSVLGYGCWRLAGTSDPDHVTPERREAGHAAVLAAYEAGYRLFDHADIYCRGVAETIFGEALAQVSGMRDQIQIASKCGIRLPGEPDAQAPYRYDFSTGHIVASCEQSLERLGVEVIDLYLLHRPDFLCEPDEVAAAFGKLKEAGKVREFGVSNFRPSQLTALQRACPMPLVVHQVQASLLHLDPFQDGTLDQCLTDDIAPLAWSPLAGGTLAGRIGVAMNDPQHARKAKLDDVLGLLARERSVCRAAVALAWLRRHPSGILPLVGSTNPDRIREATQAADLELTREEWYRLTEAASGQRLP